MTVELQYLHVLLVLNHRSRMQVQNENVLPISLRVIALDKSDSDHCVICCTEIHRTAIECKVFDVQNAVASSISSQFGLVFKFRLNILHFNIKVSHELDVHDYLVLFVPLYDIIALNTMCT